MRDYILSTSIKDLIREYPYAEDFFTSLGLRTPGTVSTLEAYLENLEDSSIEDCGMERTQIINNFVLFMEKMNELKFRTNYNIQEILIMGGHDKSGNSEDITLSMKPGEIVCIVGPTGSGKSRLLADIECLAQRDTPTGRKVLINGKAPSQEKRFSIENKLVAQLSQNMNFIMDLSVKEFITMHAESRLVANLEQAVNSIAGCANELAGEKFSLDTAVTALSGGQSRALMIADTALLSSSPIVLIDEIENAGVDRRKALDLLVRKEKIVLMSTHDPILALMGDRRVIIRNGAMNKIIETSEAERKNLELLHNFDTKMLQLRNMLRNGEKIEFDTAKFLNFTEGRCIYEK